MTHYKTLLDPTEFLGPADFPTPKTVTISRAVREKMPERKGEATTEAPMLYFSHNGQEIKRKYKVPKSVLYALSLLLGPDIDEWKGKQITLMAAKCLSFGEVEECVRPVLSVDVEAKVFKWLKKRKSSSQAFMIKETK
jgi:hypothetical protein